MCEFRVFLGDEVVMEDVVAATVEGDEVTLVDVVGRSKAVEGVSIVEVSVPATRLVLKRI